MFFAYPKKNTDVYLFKKCLIGCVNSTFSQPINSLEVLNMWLCCVPPQRVTSVESSAHFKTPSGMQSGGEEEQDDEAHPPLPPPMEIMKDTPAQDDKVCEICSWSDSFQK